MLLSDLQTKDVINMRDGNNLGRIIDARVDSSGKINYFVVEEKKILRKVTRGSDMTINFEKIKKIGEDVILVELWYNKIVIFMKKKIIFIGVFLLFVDRITKLLIDNCFNLMETKTIIINFFKVTKVYNDGASWNILSGHRMVLILLAIIMLGILIYYQNKFKMNNRNIFAFSMLYSGITGNLIDRVIYGYVIDFLDFTIFNYDFPVFNFADICIVIGVILLIIAILKKEDINEVSSR